MGRGMVGCVATPPDLQVWDGAVCAVFARSAHIKTDFGFVTVGSSALSAHPCSILWPSFTPGWRLGQRVCISAEEVRTNDGRVASLGGMRRYIPSFLSRSNVGRAALLDTLRATRDTMACMASRGGFHAVYKESVGHFSQEESASRLSEIFRKFGGHKGMALATSMRRHDWNAFHCAASSLAGLGEGLTPSGDDFLGGVLSAMRYHGRTTGAVLFPDALIHELADQLTAKTTPFSGFLLRLSAKGLVGLPFSRWLQATHRGDVANTLAAVKQAAAIGHSSGLDTLAGMLLALQILNEEKPWTEG